jgi:hypothetical protein
MSSIPRVNREKPSKIDDIGLRRFDAPLVIENATGQRPCEREIGQRFGHADASAHTTNDKRCPRARGKRLVKRLDDSEWDHNVDPRQDRRRPNRWLFEVYPHPAHVVLFNREKIIKYKKGRAADRRAGFEMYRTAISEHLSAATPALVSSHALQELAAQPAPSTVAFDRRRRPTVPRRPGHPAALDDTQAILDGDLSAGLARRTNPRSALRARSRPLRDRARDYDRERSLLARGWVAR